ncbi:hypothetical protein [Lysobacter sp. 1R34A]|uniref:hypothetical protein n=1 Tax=Lysobacter sp. 1R34A TaxID=3445786 RepID=UPI003EE93D1C
MSSCWLPSIGTRRDGSSTVWRLIVDGDPELGRYLRRQFWIAHHCTRSLQAPLWGTHVPVIRGEAPPKPAAWKRLDGAAIAFDYDPDARETDGLCLVCGALPRAAGPARGTRPGARAATGAAPHHRQRPRTKRGRVSGQIGLRRRLRGALFMLMTTSRASPSPRPRPLRLRQPDMNKIG